MEFIKRITRRQFVKGVAASGATLYATGLVGVRKAFSISAKSRIFRVAECPVHDGELRHEGLDTLLGLLAANGIDFYLSNGGHPWAGTQGIIASNDVVLIKVNCQWKCRGTTNTDVVRGLIHRILEHPDGFTGEVVIIENGQGVGAFDGFARHGGGTYPDPIDDEVYVNAEEENLLTVDYLVNSVFNDTRVSSYLLDPIRSSFITGTDHSTDGYRTVSDVSYPCFTSDGGNRIELREGIWNGSGHDINLKLINVPVLKTHGGTGITGVLKHTYGILSMSDGYSGIRHYSQSGTQCGKMWSLVRSPDLNILDCIWVSQGSLSGYPPSTTYRANTLLAGIDPVALDYWGSKYILFPASGNQEHNPDSFSGLINHLTGARDDINDSGGIGGELCHMGDDNIEVVSTSTPPLPEPPPPTTDTTTNTQPLTTTEQDGGGGGCFIATAAFGCPMANEVAALRDFRDNFLLKARVGRRLVKIYDRVSPPLANYIGRHETLRSVTRHTLKPLIHLTKYR